MPTGNLPASGKKLWESVYDKSLKGSCKGDKECAAGSAWTAVKNAGWSKDKEGNWHKKAVLTEFSLRIVKASYDKSTAERRWVAVASDVDNDLYDDNMTIELFQNFLSRIDANELAPEEFRSDFWQGGKPYLSVSHYPDLNGVAVPGDIQTVFIEGKYLKAKGTYFDTPLGRACFDAICRDLYNEEQKSREDKVRISIAFLDWMHKHKSDGEYLFERKSLSDICPECLREMLEDEYAGKTFLRGQLIHLAHTRVPVNERTSMEVDRSMTTRKEDAASIIGEELAEEMEQEAKGVVGKSQAVVIKTDTVLDETLVDPLVEEAKQKMEEDDEKDGEKPQYDEEEEKEKMDKEKKKADMDDVITALSEIRSLLTQKELPESVTAEPHILDTYFEALKASFDDVQKSQLSPNEKLQILNTPFSELGKFVKEVVRTQTIEEVIASNSGELAEMVKNLTNQMSILTAEMQSMKSDTKSVPAPRNLDAPQHMPDTNKARFDGRTPMKIGDVVKATT